MTKILVTGAAGFLGSHLVDALLEGGHEVVGLDNLTRGSLDHLESHRDNQDFTFVRGDIRDLAHVERAVEQCETVFHLAAQSNVMGAGQDIDYSFTTNVAGTFNVLAVASRTGAQRLVFASSREVYGEPEALPVNEDAMPQPKNLYGASKLAGEAYCRAFDNTLGLKCTILRLGNVYGARDTGRVIPLWIDRALAGRDLELYGGEQVLDFIHVSYCVEALIAASKTDTLGPINIASGRGTSLRELAECTLTMTDSAGALHLQPARTVEVTRFVADVSRMTTELRIRPPADPLDHLEEMIANSRAATASRVS